MGAGLQADPWAIIDESEQVRESPDLVRLQGEIRWRLQDEKRGVKDLCDLDIVREGPSRGARGSKAVDVGDASKRLHGERETGRRSSPPASRVRLRHGAIEVRVHLDEAECAGVGLEAAAKIAPAAGADKRLAHGSSDASEQLKAVARRPLKLLPAIR